MAIDTLEKRASANSFFLTVIYPAPDGTIDAGDRLQIGGWYRGIAAAAPITVSVELIRLTSGITRTVSLASKATRTLNLTSRLS